jgi:hypothetical protein
VSDTRQIGDPDPGIVRQEFPGSQVMPGSEGGWVAVWKERTYTGKSPEALVSKMRSGQYSPPVREESTEAST